MYIRCVAYLRRLVDDELARLLAHHPAVSLVGPRATGKTTTARQHAASVVRLDRPVEAGVFEADPDVALRDRPEPVLLDEWQEVPAVLGAVKRSVDDDHRPGRFILTGSVRARLDSATWPGTGRLITVPMWPLTVSELVGRTDPQLLDRWGRGDFTPPGPPPREDLAEYVARALAGGYPDVAVRLAGRERVDWLRSYLDEVSTRDAVQLGGFRDPERFRRFLEVVALTTAGIPTDVTIAQAVGADRRTMSAYRSALVNLMILDLVPAWSGNRLNRLVKNPKHYVVDPALTAAAVRLDAPGVLRDSDVLGRLLDTFVAAQLRPLVPLAESAPRLYHLREVGAGREIDLLLEFGGRGVVAIEVKAASAPRRTDARHLEWLRDQLGERFIGGVVLHTGLVVTDLAPGIHALPISSFWSAPERSTRRMV